MKQILYLLLLLFAASVTQAKDLPASKGRVTFLKGEPEIEFSAIKDKRIIMLYVQTTCLQCALTIKPPKEKHSTCQCMRYDKAIRETQELHGNDPGTVLIFMANDTKDPERVLSYLKSKGGNSKGKWIVCADRGNFYPRKANTIPSWTYACIFNGEIKKIEDVFKVEIKHNAKGQLVHTRTYCIGDAKWFKKEEIPAGKSILNNTYTGELRSISYRFELGDYGSYADCLKSKSDNKRALQKEMETLMQFEIEKIIKLLEGDSSSKDKYKNALNAEDLLKVKCKALTPLQAKLKQLWRSKGLHRETAAYKAYTLITYRYANKRGNAAKVKKLLRKALEKEVIKRYPGTLYAEIAAQN